MSIQQLFEKPKYPRRFHGECQRCQRVDYLPWATEHGERYCGWCHEKDSLEYVRERGWTPPTPSVGIVRSFDMRRPSKPGYYDALSVKVRRRSLWERINGACWLLFCEWSDGRTPTVTRQERVATCRDCGMRSPCDDNCPNSGGGK